MTTGAMTRRRLVWYQFVPIAFGVACLIAAIALLEVLIRFGIVNRFIVPTPTRNRWELWPHHPGTNMSASGFC